MNIYKVGCHGWERTQATKEEEAYFDAWLKIRDWVKHNVDVEIEEPIEIKLPHNFYHKTLFGVTPKKEAYILRGSHGWGYDDCVDWPNGKYRQHYYGTLDTKNNPECLSSITMDIIKEVVDNWPSLKEQLISRMSNLNKLFSFEA